MANGGSLDWFGGREGGGVEGWFEAGGEVLPADVGFGHAEDVRADGVLAEGDGEAVAGEGPGGGVGEGLFDGLLEVFGEIVLDVRLGVKVGDGQGGEFLLPVAGGKEDVGGRELAVAVEPPEEGGAAGEGMGGAPAVGAVGEHDVDEAVVGGLDVEVGLDGAGGVDGGVEGGGAVGGSLLAVEVDGAAGGAGFDGVVPGGLCGIGFVNLGPAEAAVAEAGVDGDV